MSVGKTYYAKWVSRITLDANDGTVTPTSVDVVENAAYGETLPTPTRTGYTFKGWYTEKTGGEKVEATTVPTGNTTLYAQWEINKYDVTFNSDGGSEFAAQEVEYGSKATMPANPTKDNYAFAGWYNGENVFDFDNTSITGDLTLTAKWTEVPSTNPHKVTVTFNSNGGSAVDSDEVYQGAVVAEPAAPTREGYTFAGWLNGTAPYNFNAPVAADLTLTAKWDVNTYTVTWNVDGKTTGDVTETTKMPDGTTGTVVTDKNGDITQITASVSSAAAKESAKTGEAVTLPVEVPAVKTTEDAPAVQITVPRSAGSVKVEIPVERVTPGTVAVIVSKDGTEKIAAASVTTEDGVVLTLDSSATVKVIDNSKRFTDVPADNVFYDEISALSAREIMVGRTDDKFDLYSSVTLNQIANVAGRITGAVDVSNFNAGVVWGAENGLKTGNAAAARGDVLKALYIAAGSPVVEDTSILARFKDAAGIPADLAAIAAWAAQNGILKGDLNGNANLSANVTRGQACALAGRTMGTLA